MEQRLSLVTLGVRDLARSRKFYEAMGWRAAKMKAEDVVFFQVGGIVIALWGREDLASDAGVADAPTGFAAVALAYNTRDKAEVDAVLARAADSGGRVVKPAQQAFWGGYQGYFADPDGHLWEVAWNPEFRIDEAGNVRLPA
jgi:catechol 2,3-dioxygenase-like lactoylglutathione lyase family enzyme